MAAGEVVAENGGRAEELADGFQVPAGLGLERGAEWARDVAQIGVIIQIDVGHFCTPDGGNESYHFTNC